MHRRGTTVSRRGGAAQRADRRWLSESADVRIAIAAPCAAHADRRGGAWEPTPVALRIAVTSLDPVPLRRPARTGRGFRAAALSAAAHAAALVIAATTMPRLEAIEEDFLFDTFAPALRRHVPSVDEEDGTPDEDGFGRAPEVCAELQPTRGHAIAVRGPTDNPDPHIARQRAPFDDLTLDVIGPLRGPCSAGHGERDQQGRGQPLHGPPADETPRRRACMGRPGRRVIRNGSHRPLAQPALEGALRLKAAIVAVIRKEDRLCVEPHQRAHAERHVRAGVNLSGVARPQRHGDRRNAPRQEPRPR